MNDPNLRRLMIHGIILFGLILFALSCVYFGVDPLHPLSLLAGAIPFFAILVFFLWYAVPTAGTLFPCGVSGPPTVPTAEKSWIKFQRKTFLKNPLTFPFPYAIINPALNKAQFQPTREWWNW